MKITNLQQLEDFFQSIATALGITFISGDMSNIATAQRADGLQYPILYFDTGEIQVIDDANKIQVFFYPSMAVLDVLPAGYSKTEQLAKKMSTLDILEEIISITRKKAKKGLEQPFDFSANLRIQKAQRWTVQNECGWQTALRITRLKNIKQ
jgi:hypothetical protein